MEPIGALTQARQRGRLARVLHILRVQGGLRTLQSGLSVVEDVLFDWFHGTDTLTPVMQHELDFQHPNKAYANTYIPTRGRAFRKVMRSIALPKGSVFVDYGSGKGKVLLLASAMGFKRIAGIEYSRRLHEISVTNIARYRWAKNAVIDPVCCDAAEYVLRDDENVFYFFNPFGLDVLRKVLKQINASCVRNPRKIVVILFNAQYKTACEAELGVQVTRDILYAGYDVAVLERSP